MVSFTTWELARASILSAALFQSNVNAQNITHDTFFYGQSPPVYPSPQQPGSSSWADAHAKAVEIVSQMTPEERANITVGYPTTNGCSGVTGSVPRLNWPGLCLADAGQGLRNTDFVNSWPSALHAGASWNRALTLRRGEQMGGEFRTKGVHVALGPVVGGLGRIATGGRNWEAFSNDPYLCGALGADTVRGIQSQGVTTSVKHFIANEQEYHRNPSRTPLNVTIESISTNIDDKTMHELYLWPFQDTVHAGAGAIMGSYQRLNNSYACQNSKALNGLLKGELGFEGFVVTDWFAQHAGIASAEAGLDLVMPNSLNFWGRSGGNLTIAVNNGSLAESRVNDMATRVIASWYQMGQDEGYPEGGIGLPVDYSVPHKSVNARDPASQPILLQGAIEGHVLVKNVNKTLPLSKPKLLSVFGYDAVAPAKSTIGDAGYGFGYLSNLGYSFFLGALQSLSPGQISPNGTLIVGGGSGGNAPAYISAPWDALQEQAYKDGTQLFWDFASGSPAVDTASDACLVFINAFATEGVDREGLHDDFSDALVLNVAANCTNTIVVIHNAGIRLVDQWIDHPNVTAVIFAHLPGQDSGRAVVQLLYGEQSPSGKLPYTIAKNESDYGAIGTHVEPKGKYHLFPQDDFTEGVYIDYRDFDRKNITPRYEFGFGLTYTTFEFSELTVDIVPNVSTAYHAPGTEVIEGGLASLWEAVVKVSAVVENTGDVNAKEVAQLYIGIPGGPVKQLRGFNKVEIPAGGNATVEFDVLRRDLSEWSVAEQQWVLQQGSYNIWVGSSSRDLPLKDTLTIGSRNESSMTLRI